ncbi:MAG TPA: FmdB family zinc ribbon protein [Thermoanaerobaculia bacterium]|nr:FmdB family zinc ribbon protein [Thermoanaerobaculia bacterium]
MPIYEYLCTACNERHEIIQRLSDAPLTHCPKCGGDMKKLISSPAIQFKGSGFYKTDYAKTPSSSTSSSSSKSGESSSDSKSDSKSETKCEAKSETKSETKSESKSESN